MIYETILDLTTNFLEFIFSLIPPLPDLPQSLHDSLFDYIDLIFSNGTNILGLFVRLNTVKIVIPLLIIIMNFDKIYSLVLWILKKIPILNMK